MKALYIQYFIILFFAGCTSNNVIVFTHQKQVEINRGDTLKLNLGFFGDEEGVRIYSDATNAKISRLIRQINTGSIVYEYLPIDTFTGADKVVLILNRGSDGASMGINDTTMVTIVVK